MIDDRARAQASTTIEAELKRVSIAVKNTFKIQSELDAQSDAIKETAAELEQLSRQKRVLETELESLKCEESNKADVDDAITDLRARLEAFRRGWPKASAVTKKALLKDAIHSMLVGPSGIKIQYRLKNGLNREATFSGSSPAHLDKNNVIDLKAQRHTAKTSREHELVADGGENNLRIIGSQVVGSGRGSRIRT